jgi:hypothetical protein
MSFFSGITSAVGGMFGGGQKAAPQPAAPAGAAPAAGAQQPGWESMLKTGLGAAKTGVGDLSKLTLPGKMGGWGEKLSNIGGLLGGQAVEGAGKAEGLAAKGLGMLGAGEGLAGKLGQAGSMLGKVADSPLGTMAKGLSESPIGKALGPVGAAIGAAQSGLATYDDIKQGHYGDAVFDGLHTLTNAAGAIPGVGTAISMGGGLALDAGKWLYDGGASKLWNGAKDVGGAALHGIENAGSAIGGAASSAFHGAEHLAGSVASHLNPCNW